MHCAKPTWLNSLAMKVLLAYVAGVVLSIAVLLAAFSLITTQSDILLSADVFERTQELAEELRFDQAGRPVAFAEGEKRTWMYDSLRREVAYRVLDAGGAVALASSTAPGSAWPVTRETQRLVEGSFRFELDGVPMYAGTVVMQHAGRIWYMQFATSARMMDLFQRAFALPFMGAGIVLFSLVMLFVFGACALVTLRFTLKPLREVSESAAAISPHALHARLQVDTVPAEIAPLVSSFNRVLERLEHGYRVQQGFLSTAAHELKTPLALIRAQIELSAHSKERNALLGDIAHMTRQVQQLLMLAETSEVQNYIFAEVDVAGVAHDAVAYLQRMAESARVQLRIHATAIEGGPAIAWRADRAALFTLLKNLLENAIEHAPAGTEVSVSVEAQALTVRDRGPGVTEEQLAQLFERFWRGAHRRDHGAGLGLSICREIAQAHGWTLSAHLAKPGLLFRLDALHDARQRTAESGKNVPG